ncbi:MAG: helix-turn-helix transcriptional regulator [Gloeomargaritaceae cyanobacterium C42_A2020_066]|nr:helix-turn-helix transcriptional regulator [Gloeomargaritaceae cyanobacterium C42_A2020_066]
MTLHLTTDEFLRLWDVANPTGPLADGAILYTMPPELGEGYAYDLKFGSGSWIRLYNLRYLQDILVSQPEWLHPVEFTVLLSGQIATDQGDIVGNGNALISGGGIQRDITLRFQGEVPCLGITIESSPEDFIRLFTQEHPEPPQEVRLLVKQDDWQTLCFPKMTAGIRAIAQAILNCPFQGITRRLYLQAKSQELIALMLATILGKQSKVRDEACPKPPTAAKLDQARQVLDGNLEDPPTITVLAKQVGLSERTLQRGFQQLYGNTVFGYLTQKRMEKARCLLHGRLTSVAEVANLVGYANPSHFGAAFKRFYGITPQECIRGK